MPDDEEDFEADEGAPSPIPAKEPLSEETRARLKQRRHEAGLVREKTGGEGRNDPYLEPERLGPHVQHKHGAGEGKQAHSDAASGPDRTPDASRGNRKR